MHMMLMLCYLCQLTFLLLFIFYQGVSYFSLFWGYVWFDSFWIMYLRYQLYLPPFETSQVFQTHVVSEIHNHYILWSIYNQGLTWPIQDETMRKTMWPVGFHKGYQLSYRGRTHNEAGKIQVEERSAKGKRKGNPMVPIRCFIQLIYTF